MSFTSDDNTLVCGFLRLSLLDVYFFRDDPMFLFLTPSKGGDPLLTVHQQDYVLWPCQSSTVTDSELLGQTVSSCWFNKVHSIIPNLSAGMYWMLNNDKALIGSPTLKFLSVVNVAVLNEIQINLASPGEERKVKEIIFSQKGDTIYFISGSTNDITSKLQDTRVTVFDTSSRKIKTIRNVPSCKIALCSSLYLSSVSLFPVKEGVVLFTYRKVLELWNSDLTECIRPLSTLMNIKKLIPISDELIACQRNTVDCHVTIDIVDITSGELISSVKTKAFEDPFSVFSICCNSQQQVLISTYETSRHHTIYDIIRITVSLWNTDSSLMWETSSGWFITGRDSGKLTFSPQDEFVVTWNCLDSGNGVHVLDAKTGEIFHSFLQISQNEIVDCKFVANGESLVCCSEDNFLRLFNVRSGDLLSVLDIGERPFSLGACQGRSLVAIGLSGVRLKFIHVELPRVKDAEEKKG
ncbi:hypothetical protein OS493_037476 [Desmophyllum pertusum]|uniref:Uncharacterized protein n=1 Tax=Desmophyllum pertusum TaxID=174260 RepID=A0A9W9Z7V8_9CNID|nr:hypothetical protein OS493_037476 [Desmophyllum pertusum]